MKVSIITVCLNSERHLRDCIGSVRQQTYKNIEYIVVDGKSTDGTLEIIQQNRDVITHFISETDRGMYDAINKGIKLATGDIVGILNSDDMYASSGSVRKIVDCFLLSKSDSVYGDLVYIDPVNENHITRFWKGRTFSRRRFCFGWMPAHPTFYIRRSLIEQYGLYENHFYTAADYEFMARYLYKHRCSATYLEEVLVKMRIGGMSNGSLKRRFRANRRDYLAMKKNKIPFSFIVSILKPISKLHQYKKPFSALTMANLRKHPTVVFVEKPVKQTENAHVSI